MAPSTSQIVLVVVAAAVLAACGSSGPVVSGDGAPTPAPASTLLDGVPDDCRLVDEVSDPALRALQDGIDPAARRGPLVVATHGGARVAATTTYGDPVGYGEAAAWVVPDAEADITAANPLAAELADFRLDVVDTAGGDAVASALASATDCSHVAAAEARPDLAPTRPPPQLRDDLLTVTPATPTPGSVVEVTFAEDTMRGIAWNLDQRDGDRWTTRFWLVSDANGGEPDAVPAGTQGWGVNDVGVAGTGPDRVLIPEETEPGSWRLCTANRGEEICASVEIAPAG